jgi:hypothetical protein
MIGKKIGKDNIYIHMSAVSTLPSHLVERYDKALRRLFSYAVQRNITFPYNFVITHPDYISFVEAEDFDTTFEPVLGARYKVSKEGTVTFIPRPAKPKILHQRYKTVKADYKGFDIEEDKAREAWYRSYFDGKRMAGAGFEHKWVAMINRAIEETHRKA